MLFALAQVCERDCQEHHDRLLAMSQTRTVLAFAVAPLWVPLSVVSAVFLFDPYVHQDGGVVAPGIVSTLVTYIGVLTIGLPAFLFLKARGWTSWKLAVALGLAAGLVMLAAFGIVFGFSFGEDLGEQLKLLRQETLLSNAIAFLVTGGLGALVGITLWSIARPDRQANLSFPAERGIAARGEGNPGI
ncbi:MAG TPA: hypothetical protein VHC39_16065 [Rhizomicrobium sp.]|nr:hypothetical protein [Rhizomicrobium sp.]